MMIESAAKRITFFARNPTICPVCEAKFFREELISGGGRLIAGKLTEELRREYEASRKFGELYPLIYTVMVCPSCLYAAYPADFLPLKEDTALKIQDDAVRRTRSVFLIFPDLDFADYRDLEEGAASFLLAIMCYDSFGPLSCPSLKQGLSALRAAWLFSDLNDRSPGEHFDYLSRLFYRKAAFFYRLAFERAIKGTEALEAELNYGPDLDKNYGYDGFLYITGLLQYKYGAKKNREKRILSLEEARRTVSRLFGTGKASKNKPSPLLEKAKDLYEQMNVEIKILKGEG
jgi:hypothetical protein